MGQHKYPENAGEDNAIATKQRQITPTLPGKDYEKQGNGRNQ
jgi:hypothetical protein